MIDNKELLTPLDKLLDNNAFKILYKMNEPRILGGINKILCRLDNFLKRSTDLAKRPNDRENVNL